MYKKEQYFTKENIGARAKELYANAKKYSKDRALSIDKEHLALIVTDMQEYFLNKKSNAFIPSSPAIIAGMREIIELCDTQSIPVIFTRHINTEDNAQMMDEWWNNLSREEDELSKISSALDVKGHPVVTKSQYDAFYETDLESMLKDRDVHQLIICGVMTNLCCETTARSAFIRGFQPLLPLDLTAAYNYNFHLSTALNLAFGFSRPTLSSELIKAIRGNHD